MLPQSTCPGCNSITPGHPVRDGKLALAKKQCLGGCPTGSATPDTFVVTVNHIAGVAHKVQIGTSTDVSFIVVGNIIGGYPLVVGILLAFNLAGIARSGNHWPDGSGTGSQIIRASMTKIVIPQAEKIFCLLWE